MRSLQFLILLLIAHVSTALTYWLHPSCLTPDKSSQVRSGLSGVKEMARRAFESADLPNTYMREVLLAIFKKDFSGHRLRGRNLLVDALLIR